MLQLLNYYTTALQSIKQGTTKYGSAPHKPILLLSILDIIEELHITDNHIPIDQTLKDIFIQNWKKLVNTGHDCDINKPLFHLQNDGFWTAILSNGAALDQARGISKIKYGQVDDALFQLMQSDEYRPILKMVILDTYFEQTQQHYLQEKPYPNYIVEIDQMIWEAPQQDRYRQTTRLVEGFVRDKRFQKALLHLYDGTCCMSRMKTVPNIGIVEACHIQPHVIAGNSHPTNGIPLCRNLHRAFDGGFISINEQYQILIKSDHIFKEAVSPYNFRQLSRQPILLPQKEAFSPSLAQLHWHRKRHGF